ncbi:MAG: hypothetical protein AAFY59_20100, partial [Pseudomonadota bacterium]
VHAETPLTVADLETATQKATTAAQDAARSAAEAAGAATPEITTAFNAKSVTIDGREIFLEGTARAAASGRPRLAEPGI